MKTYNDAVLDAIEQYRLRQLIALLTDDVADVEDYLLSNWNTIRQLAKDIKRQMEYE